MQRRWLRDLVSRQARHWATLGGAEVAGLADRTGSLTPGKKADVVILDGSAVNMAPINTPNTVTDTGLPTRLLWPTRCIMANTTNSNMASEPFVSAAWSRKRI